MRHSGYDQESINRYTRRKDQFKKLMRKGIAAVLAATMVMSYFPFNGSGIGATDVYAATSTDSNPINSNPINMKDLVTGNSSFSQDFNSNSENGQEGVGVGIGTSFGTATMTDGQYQVTSGTDTATVQDAYKINANSASETFKSFANMEEWRDREVFDAPANTYSLTVATGATDGSKVLYFGIKYKDKNKVSRTQFIFPHVDAQDRSAKLLNYYAKGSSIYDTYGSKMLKEMNYKETPTNQKALQSFSVQDYAFQTEAEIATVESIDVYVEVGSWTVQGMSLYKVDKYKGMEEYGLVSGETFLDFEGYMITDVQKSNPGSQVTVPTDSAGADAIVRITKDQNNDLYIENYTGKTEENTRGFAVNSSLYTLRMDFSDVYNGGLEMFINEKAQSMKAYGGIVEDMVMEIQYKDIHGWTRKVNLPVVLSSYGMALQTLGDRTIMGFGQRGDTIAFQGVFPEYSTIMGNPVIYVGDKARKIIAENGITTASSTSKMSQNLSKSGSDDVRIAGVSLYKGGCMPVIIDGTDNKGNTVQGATLQYVFEGGEPVMYQTTDQIKGRLIKSNGSEVFKMSKYKSGNPIVAARKGGDQFLVTITTNKRSKTTASSDMSLRLYYNTIDGQQTNTVAYKAKEGANDYMGIWPDVNGGNFLENSSIAPEGQVSFLVEAKDFQNFTAAEITVLGDKNWVMDNITISYVSTYNSRLAYLRETEMAGVKSNYWLERSARVSEFFNLRGVDYKVLDANGKDVNAKDGEKSTDGSGKVQLVVDGVPQYDENGNPVLVDYNDVAEVKTSGNQVFKPGSPYTITFDNDTEIDTRTTTYADVRYSMTYAQAKMDWGFFREKKKYDVAVQVASDSDYDDGNGNSGSTNHFYFQLLFNNGNSAYVLANQQLSADGFRSGREETFSISINQDYGELKGMRIIPEDLSNAAEPFDKLNIQKITISEQTKGGSFISYVIDQVGWIDIDFRDELESASSHGQKARTAAELSKIYKISYKERNVKLLCEVTYEPWSGEYGQFTGSIKAVIEYVTASTNEVKRKTVDVAQCMASYLNVQAKSVEPTAGSDGTLKIPAEGLGTYTDPETMMRPNHTDRFIIPAISDLKSIKSVTFTAKNTGEYLSIWNIGKVSISQIVKDGELKLTDNDEYVRDMTTKHLCTSENLDTISTELEIGNAKPIEKIKMTYNEIVWSSEEWATPVTRVPESEDDTVNIFIYPQAGYSGGDNADFAASFNYFIPFSQYKTASVGTFKHTTDALGNDVFFAEGIGAAGFVNAGALKVRSYNPNMYVDHAVVQHVKSGTVVGNYTYFYNGATAKNYPSAEPLFNNNYLDHCKEVLALSFGPGTEKQELISEGHDIAIGFTYTSTIDDGKTEFQSPFVYLTDVGINEISEGLFAEIPFSVPYVKQITGYQIAAYGNVEGTIIGAAAQVYHEEQPKQDANTGETVEASLTRRSYAAFAEDKYSLTSRLTPHMATSDVPYSDDVKRSVTPVSITFRTSGASKDTDSSTSSAVRMYVKYRKYDGTTPTEPLFEDVTPYIQGPEKKFVTDKEQTVKFFLQGMSEDLTIISLYIVPYNSKVKISNERAQVPQSEKDYSTVETILNEAGDGEGVDLNNQAAADMTKEILESRNAFWKISGVVVNLGFGERIINRDNLDQEFSGLSTNNTLRLSNVKEVVDITKNSEAKRTIESGTVLSYTAKSGDKFTGHVFVVDSDSGFEVKAYKVVGTAKEEVASSISDNKTDSFVFTVPENKTGELVVYRLEIYPKDGPDLVEVVEITVESDPPETATSTDAAASGSTDQP